MNFIWPKKNQIKPDKKNQKFDRKTFRKTAGSVTAIYHFYYPDDVVSARIYSDLCEDLAKKKWKVRVLTSNGFCSKDGQIRKKKANNKGVSIFRIWRPAFDQSHNIYRMINALWMFAGYIWKIIYLCETKIYIIGSEPQFSQIIIPFIRLLRPKSIIIFWCFDLYPDAVSVYFHWQKDPIYLRMSEMMVKKSFQYTDVIVDIGECMEKRLKKYATRPVQKTIMPWALFEPEKIPEKNKDYRLASFGKTKLVLLYSGNLGKAHKFENFLKLARLMRESDPYIIFAFGCRGNRLQELKSNIRSTDTNIRILPFASESELEKRLASADIHMISIKEQWTGIVVPSKFFGSLAIGRPVLYDGPMDSSIGKWIKKYDVGLILSQKNLKTTSQELSDLAKNPSRLTKWQQNAFNTYRQKFSKRLMVDKWDQTLERLVNSSR